jgi:hypothetical protein
MCMCVCVCVYIYIYEVQHKAIDLVERMKWNIMLCSLVYGYQGFAGNHCLHETCF